jgi:hypothetical protein
MGFSVAFSIMILVIMVWVYYWCFSHPRLKSERLGDLLDQSKFKTGDLILFKAVDNFNGSLIMSYYGHVGIVYVENDVPYIFEAADPTNMALDPDQNHHGIFMSPLESRAKTYKGYTYHKELKTPLSPEILDEFKSFIDYCLDNMAYETRVVSNGIKKGAGEKIGLRVNCGELVFLSLIKLGLIPIEYYEKKSFHHLNWMCTITDLTDNGYLEPVKITYSPIE